MSHTQPIIFFKVHTVIYIPCHAMHHVVHSQSAAQVEEGIPSFTWYDTYIKSADWFFQFALCRPAFSKG